MTVSSLIVARWIVVHGLPSQWHTMHEGAVVAVTNAPSREDVVAFVYREFRQPLSLTLADRVSATLIALAMGK